MNTYIARIVSSVFRCLNMKFHEDMYINKRNIEKQERVSFISAKQGERERKRKGEEQK